MSGNGSGLAAANEGPVRPLANTSTFNTLERTPDSPSKNTLRTRPWIPKLITKKTRPRLGVGKGWHVPKLQALKMTPGMTRGKHSQLEMLARRPASNKAALEDAYV